VIVYVRLTPGVVPEERRLVHVVDFPDDAGREVTDWPYPLVALCGYTFMPGYTKQLDYMAGIWCPICFQLAHDPVSVGPLA
jgi:hypothetical protein